MREQRPFEFRAATEGGKLSGHAAVFNTIAQIGRYFREQVSPGAFSKSILESDVRALWNHDPNHVLGRNKSGTLRLSEDEAGLAVEIDPPDTQMGRDVVTLIKRGDVSQMSFGFIVRKAEWDESNPENPLRTITEAELFDVSPVTYPAYKETDISVRAAETILAARREEIRAKVPQAAIPSHFHRRLLVQLLGC